MNSPAIDSTPPLHVLVLHGPNLNMLGVREPAHYGNNTLADINIRLQVRARAANTILSDFQTNSESAMIEQIHAAYQKVDFILINPAAFTHTSIAIRDALAAVAIPFIEIHLSNVHARETFRHHSHFSDLAVGVISGLGAQGYELALEYVLTQYPHKA
ncbi:MAG TPA: type II 3-dehydroquinate dehydratase [Burkholderiales bacterium]|nr:type II 3-dehydroquinate dehydratase [Burkholderiales bacterium]